MTANYDNAADRIVSRVSQASADVAPQSFVDNCGDVAYSWVPRSTKVCGFCCMMASQPAKYKANAKRPHRFCNCELMPETRAKKERLAPTEVYDRGWRELFEGYGHDRHGNRISKFASDKVFDTNNGLIWIKADSGSRRVFFREVDEDSGRIDYSTTPRDKFGKFKDPNADDLYAEENIIRNKENEWRDLYAHDMLKSHGYDVRPRATSALSPTGEVLEGVTLVDIDIDGVLWEIKSPSGSNPRRNVERQLAKARDHNFKNPYDEVSMSGMGKVSDVRVVLNTRYADFDDSNLSKEIAEKMEEKGITGVIHITKTGSVFQYEK